MEIKDTFVQVAPDCPVTVGVVPTATANTKPSIHLIQYELLSACPYRFTIDELIYEVHLRHKEIPVPHTKQERDTIWGELFQKSHPCMRASMLLRNKRASS